MIRTTVLVLAALVLAGCSADNDQLPAATTSRAGTPAASSMPADPYAAYLAKAPKGEPKLSRDDASTRALLGCGKTWPPGTVDAVLAEAYADYCPK